LGENIVTESTSTAIDLRTPPSDPQTEAVARRIDEVLRERKRNAAKRRNRELEIQSGSSQRAFAGYLRLRAAHLDKLKSVSPELRERRGSRMKTVEAAFEAVMASNAACEALSGQSR
jgi:predicted dinucleotide-utilizing enzyme